MSTYRELVGKKIKKVTSDPSNSADGQMWYNSTTGNLRGLAVVSAWSSASPLIATNSNAGAAGTQTAALLYGGRSGGSQLNTTQEYNGSGFSVGGAMGTARCLLGGGGTQTAALASTGKVEAPPSVPADTEEYNGTSWSEQNNVSTPRFALGGAGTQTANVIAGGRTPTWTTATEEYDGTSWTNGGALNQSKTLDGSVTGSLTAAVAFGGDGNPPTDAVNDVTFYDGTSWTETGNLPTATKNGGSAGTQTSAIFFGGRAPSETANAFLFDGTSFSATGSLGSAVYIMAPAANASNNKTALSMGGYSAGSSAYLSKVEEFTSSTNVITAGAWASAATMGSALYGRGGCGTTTAGLLCGGHPNPGQTTETFDGTSFSEVGDLGTGRRIFACFGTQTAAVAAGGNTNPGRISTVEEWDGSSWSANPNSLPATIMGNRGTGTQTAGLIFGGTPGPPSTVTAETLEFDGTSFSDSNDLNTARSALGGAGIQTASLAYGGNIGPPTVSSATESYNGTSWTNSPTPLIAARQQQGAAGTSTAAASFGGSNPVPSVHANYYEYNGTSWITQPSMANARSYIAGFGTTTSVLGGGGYGVPAPTRNQTEEFTGETTAANVKTFSTS